jgi:hypothetical protein
VWPKSGQNVAKKWPKVAKSGQKWPKVAKSGQKWPKVAKSGQKWPGLPDGIKNPDLGILEGLAMRMVGKFYAHLVFFTLV